MELNTIIMAIIAIQLGVIIFLAFRPERKVAKAKPATKKQTRRSSTERERKIRQLLRELDN
jgi:hypothetical protein